MLSDYRSCIKPRCRRYAGRPDGNTPFDILIDAMSYLPDASRSSGFNKLAASNASNIRGIYGEAAAFKRLKEERYVIPGGTEVEVLSLKSGERVHYNGRDGVEGVDIEGEYLLASTVDAAKINFEIKNLTSASGYSIKVVEEQAEKHIETVILSEIKNGKWASKKPLLHYEWMGSVFYDANGAIKVKYVQDRIKKIQEICNNMLGVKNVSLNPKFNCEEDITFRVLSDLVEPLTK